MPVALDREEDDYLMISGIQHFAFCQRQWALIHIEQQWQENVLTTQGKHVHERVDDDRFDETRGDLRIVRAMPILSERLKLRGIADMVEFRRVSQRNSESVVLEGREGLWTVVPIEYKRGKPKTDDRDIVQLCAQALCLEEMLNVYIPVGIIYYSEIRKREKIELTAEYRQRVEELVVMMRRYYDDAITPRAIYKQHCKQCSLVEICQPKLSSAGAKSAAKYIELYLGGREGSDGY
ncbi:CRISPR-associated protein Cas4 [Sulfoacidibacillus thermotolerans]|uniref:CRISPR-associated exonuclease Cas4 n=1 Tax=Sulfoacidibacillus thermotolerans TaxID=1765684 RepID=A0A2U3D8H1_SULT2|nr:CRISPR-associated protein Cas4 [Sulfoacidibacillus thermotolerans]PWI57577.1 CRISPR-associated protein Cas4 [Sulfoacidibacillus thermotolerans]